MNTDTDFLGEDDDEFLANYRLLANETAPDALDAAVLAAADIAARGQQRESLMLRWWRPLSFASVVVLSFAIVLQVSVLQPPETSAVLTQPANSGAPSAFEAAGASVAEQVRQVERSTAPPNNGDTVTTGNTAPQMAPVAPTRMLEVGCKPIDRQSASSWWQCVVALERDGSATAAERELKDLLAAFPRFVSPE